MTPVKAIEVLSNFVASIKSDYSTECLLAFKVAIQSLRKQIPKSPVYVDTRFRQHGKRISDGSSLSKCYKCPNCGTHIFHVFNDEKCCIYCGQLLDWGDINV